MLGNFHGSCLHTEVHVSPGLRVAASAKAGHAGVGGKSAMNNLSQNEVN